MERLERIQALSRRGELDRPAGHLRDRECGSAARIAVELGEDDPRVIDSLQERRRDVHRVLAGHRVGDEQGLGRLDAIADRRRFAHHRFVDVETAGRVDDHDVSHQAARLFHAGRGDIDGGHARARDDGNVDLVSQQLQLLDRCRTPEVASDEERPLALALQQPRELPRRRRLPGTLKAGEHDDRRRLRRPRQRRRRAAEDLDQLVVDDLHDRLRRRERLAYLFAHRALAHPADERAHDVRVHVGLEQREPDLAQDFVDLLLGKTAAAAEAAEDSFDPFA